MKVTVRGRAGPARCALCHDEAGELDECLGCGALVHLDCRAEAPRCPTLGCQAGAGAYRAEDAERARVAGLVDAYLRRNFGDLAADEVRHAREHVLPPDDFMAPRPQRPAPPQVIDEHTPLEDCVAPGDDDLRTPLWVHIVVGFAGVLTGLLVGLALLAR